MLVTAVAAAGIGARFDRLPEVGAVVLALLVPEPAAAMVAAGAVLSLRRRASEPSEEAVYLQAVALELRAGATVRSALESAALRSRRLPLARVTRLAAAGAPMSEIASSLSAVLPQHGPMAAAAVRTAGLTGGRVASVFDTLAQIAAEDRELDRERRVATAQARISAWIVGGLPIALLGFGIVSGRLGSLLDTGVGAAVVGIGLAFIAAGTIVVARMLRTATR